MGSKTSIEWTSSTWSALRGCSRTIAAGAQTSGCGDQTGGGCYAERNGYRFAGPGLAYEGLVRMTPKGARWTGKVMLVDKHLLDPIRWQRPRRIFTTSVSDPFHERFTNETIALIYGVIVGTPRHTHQLLTKRVRRAREWYGWLAREAAAANGGRGMSPAAFCFCLLQRYVADRERFTDADRKLVSRGEVVADAMLARWPLSNLWVIASTEHQPAADERLSDLREIPAAVIGLSCEPLLGSIDLDLPHPEVEHTGPDARSFCSRCGLQWPDQADTLERHVCPPGFGASIGWVIIGAESGPGARPADPAWFRSIVEQCTAAGVPVFVKQMVIDGKLCKELSEFPSDLQRREFPR